MKNIYKAIILIFSALFIFIGAYISRDFRNSKQNADSNKISFRPNDGPIDDIPIINAHEHIESPDNAKRYLKIAEKFNIEKSACFADSYKIFHRTGETGKGQDEADKNEAVIKIGNLFSGKFMPFICLDSFGKERLAQIEEYFKNGATGINIRFRKAQDIDNSETWPLYSYCEKKGIPIVIHFQKGRFEAIQNILRSFPKLKVNFPHLMYSIDNIDFIETMLRKYQNLYTDFTYGYLPWMKSNFEKLSRKSVRVRELVEHYPDRFLWGTDCVVTNETFKNGDKFLSTVIAAYRDFPEKKIFYFPLMDKPEIALHGLNLRRDVLEKIYNLNPKRFMEMGQGDDTGAQTVKKQEIKVFLQKHPEYANIEPADFSTIVITGSSLLGEGMARVRDREKNNLILSKKLIDAVHRADIFHMSNESPIVKDEKKMERWKFYSTPKDIDFLNTLDVDLLELTGNHLLDYGDNSFKRLFYALRSFAIPYFGGGMNLSDAQTPLTVIDGNNRFTFIGFNMISGIAKNGSPGGNPYSEKRMIAQIKKAKEEGNIVSVHFQWGDDLSPQPYYFQRLIAYRAIDAGADIIIGTHSHSVSGYEKYRDRHIFYGLGNFIFRDDTNESTRTGVMIKLYCLNNRIVDIDLLPVRNDLGELKLVNDIEKKAIVQKWEDQSSYLSAPEKAKLALDIECFSLNGLGEINILPAILNRCSIGRVNLFLRPEKAAKAVSIASENDQLKNRTDFGLIIDDRYNSELIRELIKSLGIKKIELVSLKDSPEKAIDYIQQKNTTVIFGDDWTAKRIEEVIDRYYNSASEWFISFKLLYMEEEKTEALLKKYEKIKMLIRFDSDEDLDFWSNEISERAPKIKKIITEWSARIKIGFGISGHKMFSSKEHEIRYDTRRFFAVRNMLETAQYKFPILSDPGLKWNYPYEKETVKKGCNLETSKLREIYKISNPQRDA